MKRSPPLKAAALTHRRRWDAQLASRPNVNATAFGIRRTDGVLADSVAYVVFVSKKKPRSRLRSEDLIPRFVTRGGRRFHTDVEEIDAPIDQALALSDGVRQSTTSCFARGPHGVFAVSCAHGLLGPDRSAFIPNPVAVWVPSAKRWEAVGSSGLLLQSSGSGVPPHDFGFADVGLVNVDSPWLKTDIDRRSPLVISPLLALGTAVRGEGVVSGHHHAIVRALWLSDVAGTGLRCDVIIEHPNKHPLTLPGDSGMLWLDSQGRALALHAKGILGPPGGASIASLSMLARRLPGLLAVELVK